MSLEEPKKKSIGPKGMRWLVWSMYILMVITIVVSWVFYPIRYEFWEQATSTLGGLFARDTSESNFPSYIIFACGFLGMGCIAFLTASLYFKHSKKFRFAIIKGILLVFVGIGTVGIAIPYDYVPLVLFHQIGAFTFLSSIAALNFVFQLLRCVARYGVCVERDLDFYVDYTFVVLLILAAVLYYATELLYFLIPEFPWIQPALMQKILLFTAIIAAGLLDLDDIN